MARAAPRGARAHKRQTRRGVNVSSFANGLRRKKEESDLIKPKNIFTATIAAAVLAGSVAAATPASAGYWRHYGYGWGPYAAGAAGALALGVMAATAAEADSCYYESRPIYRHGYFVGYRQIPVC
jgi:hypothetical protein